MWQVSLVSSGPLLVSLGWIWLAAAGDSPWSAQTTLLLSCLLLFHSLIGIVGLLIAGSWWSRWWLAGVVVIGSVWGWSEQVSTFWWVMLVLSVLSLAGLTSPALTAWLRSRPYRIRPPVCAVGLGLALMAVPLLVGVLVGNDLEFEGWWGSLGALFTGFWYMRTWPWAVPLVRVVYPLVLGLAGLLEGGRAGWLLGGVAVLVLLVAWHKDVRLAANPVVQNAKAVPILPELTPEAILRQAGLDRKGQKTG